MQKREWQGTKQRKMNAGNGVRGKERRAEMGGREVIDRWFVEKRKGPACKKESGRGQGRGK